MSAAVIASGIVYCSVCVPAEWSPDEIEAFANREVLILQPLRWALSDDETFSGGQPNPCPCEQRTGFNHHLLSC